MREKTAGDGEKGGCDWTGVKLLAISGRKCSVEMSKHLKYLRKPTRCEQWHFKTFMRADSKSSFIPFCRTEKGK